jgi:putative addiction module component (TIGR02574 family)
MQSKFPASSTARKIGPETEILASQPSIGRWRKTHPSPENGKEWGAVPIAFARVVSYAGCMELLTHDELARLTPPERLTLISQLWDSLEDNHLPLTAAQRGELDRRLATLDEDRREGITWAALKTELELRCP